MLIIELLPSKWSFNRTGFRGMGIAALELRLNSDLVLKESAGFLLALDSIKL